MRTAASGKREPVLRVPTCGAPWAEGIERKTIGMKAMCALLDISPETLRKYEASGAQQRYFLSPNGYRHFPYSSLSQLYELRSLVRAGMGIKEASRLACGTAPDERAAAFAACREENRRQIARLELCNEVLARRERLLDEFRACEGTLVECVRPALWRLSCGLFSRGPESRRAVEAVRRWTSLMPAAFLCPSLPLDQRGPEALLDVGVAVEADLSECLRSVADGWLPWEAADVADAPDVPGVTGGPGASAGAVALEEGLAVAYLPERRMYATGISIDERLHFPNRASGWAGFIDPFEPLFARIAERGMRVAGDLVHRFVATEERDGRPVDCYLAWVPVEQV